MDAGRLRDNCYFLSLISKILVMIMQSKGTGMATKSERKKPGKSIGPLDSQLRSAIRADGRSVNSIAFEAHIPQSNLYKFASQQRDITIDHAGRVAKALSIRLYPAREGDGDSLDSQLRAAIRADGRSMKALGIAASVTSTHLPKFMSGIRGMKLTTAGRIASTLGLAFGPVEAAPPVIPDPSLGCQLIDAIRSDPHRSINAIALTARINPPNVYRFVSGKQDLKLDAAGRIADVLGLRLGPLSEGKGDSLDSQLRAAIRADGRSIGAIAIAAGVNASHMAPFMSGKWSLHLATAGRIATAINLKFIRAELNPSTDKEAKVSQSPPRCPVELQGEGLPILVYGQELPIMRGVAYAVLDAIHKAFLKGGGCTPGELKGLINSDRCLRLFIQALKRPGFEPLREVIPSWNAGKGKLFEIVDVRPKG